jgi:hypothetical protein
MHRFAALIIASAVAITPAQAQTASELRISGTVEKLDGNLVAVSLSRGAGMFSYPSLLLSGIGALVGLLPTKYKTTSAWGTSSFDGPLFMTNAIWHLDAWLPVNGAQHGQGPSYLTQCSLYVLIGKIGLLLPSAILIVNY